MNQFRGILMLAASAVGFYKGWKIHTGPSALLGYTLGVLALVMAVWHLTRKTPPPRPANHA